MTRPTKDPDGLLNPSKRPMLCARLSVGNCLLESNQLYCSWCSQRKLNQVRLVWYIFKCTMVHVARAAPRLFTQWTHSSAAWNERFPTWAPEISSICSSFQWAMRIAGFLMIWYDLWITDENSKLTKHVDLTYDFCRRNTRPPCPPTTPSAVSASRSAAPYAKAPFRVGLVRTARGKLGGFSPTHLKHMSHMSQNGNLLPQFSGWK